jgi:hypothetical protein
MRRAQLGKTQRRTLAEVLRKIDEQMSRPEIRPLDASSAPMRPYVQHEKSSSFQAESEKTK